jgi:geranylgeranyl diphosphate synthase type II
MECISSYISSRCQTIEKTLDELIESKDGQLHSTLFEAARYSLLSKAKRLRPLLTLATAESFECDFNKALHPACAIEILHTYSLIHDDLPCMDDDDLRRGRPTLHKVYGEGHAVLTGDFLLTFAFDVLANSPDLSSDQKIELIKTLSQKAGAHGMIGGQTVDLLHENKLANWQTLEFIHANKTAALIAASLDFGAIIAGAPLQDRIELRHIGHEIGLSYQIIDDILDVTAKQEDLGKTVHSDISNNKSTAITVLGIDQAQLLANELLNSVQQRCKKLSVRAPLLEEMLQKLIHRTF